jgi:hypothetical protein
VAALSRRAPAALGLVLLAAGCASFVRLDPARTAPPGKREVAFAPSFYVGRADGTAFNVDLLIRNGLSERTDVGVRFDLLGAAADLKWQVVRASDPSRGVDLAVAPTLGYGADVSWQGSNTSTSAWNWQVGLPVLIGINLGCCQLTLTPELLYQRVAALPDGVLDAGGTVGFGKMGGSGFGVYPVVAVWKALDARQPLTSLRGPGALVVQPALVFRWGP